MRSGLFGVLLSLSACTLACRAQAAIDVTPCELIASPEKYSGKTVQVRARVDLAFEDFSLAQEGCADAYPGVWLVYGGDEPTPTMSTVNDQERKPGSVLKVNSRPIPLVHDAALDLFRKRLNAARISKIGDRPCYDCYLYQVTATLTGVFFAAQRQGQRFAGYGHLGCCHLLAIEQVSDVDARRTPIPMGGSFECASENRTLDALAANQLKALEKPCVGLTYRQCQEQSLQIIAAAAKYWNDPIEPEDGSLRGGEIAGNTEKQEWESADKLKTYTVSIQSDDPTKTESKATGGVVTRSVCHAAIPPLPMSTIVDCQNLWSEFPAQKEQVQAMSRNVAAGKETWRMTGASDASRQALDEAANVWSVALANGFLPADCEEPMIVDGDQFVWCHWMAQDGMQSLNVEITRFGYLRHGRDWASVPWFLMRGNGIVCKAEP